MNFTVRADQLEILDHPGIPAEDIRLNMHELSVINDKLGGHDISWKGFTVLANKVMGNHICEIGCGGGDNLKAIEKRADGKYQQFSMTGIDINADCIEVAKEEKWNSPVRFITNDYKQVQFDSKPDIIFCSLFCHHFKEMELEEMFRWLRDNSIRGFFINDLHRHPLAYHSIRFLTRLFSKSYLVKNDAPLSVLRGFKKRELQELLSKAGIANYTIQWKWAFRWLVIVRK